MKVIDHKLRKEYRDLRMMQDKLDGFPVDEIAAAWSVSTRTASACIKAIASECMRQAMEQTQGDPDHPATMRFTLEEFTRDPRFAMAAIMRSHLAKIEEQFPELQ